MSNSNDISDSVAGQDIDLQPPVNQRFDEEEALQLTKMIEAKPVADVSDDEREALGTLWLSSRAEMARTLKDKFGNRCPAWIRAAQNAAKDMTSPASRVSAIRSMPSQKFPRAVKLGKAYSVVVRYLNYRGRFYRTDNNATFWMEDESNQPLPLEGESFSGYLAPRLAIAPSESFFKHLVALLRTQVAEQGDLVSVHRLAHFDPETGKLYVSRFGEGLYILDGETITAERNCSDGVMFLEDMSWEPWEYCEVEDDEGENFQRLVVDINLDGRSGLSRMEARLVLETWLAGVFFSSILPTRPLLLLRGEAGSGKTTRARLILQTLFGRNAEVTTITRRKEDDVDAALTNNPLVVFDNVDEEVPWLPDKLAVAATGGSLKKRKYYTTNTQIEYRFEAQVVLTARSPKFGRDDVAQRTLILPLRPIDEYIAEDSLLREAREKRDELMSIWIERLNKAVRVLKDGLPNIPVPFRMADYGRLLQVLAEVWYPELSQGDLIQLFDKLTRLQASIIGDYEPLVDRLGNWIDDDHLQRDWYMHEIHEELQSSGRWTTGTNEDLPASPAALGKTLRRLQDALREVYGIEVKFTRDREGRQVKFTRVGDGA